MSHQTSTERLYAERLTRYIAAMRNEKPDRIPIRPFVAEFAGKYAGFTNQEVTHDYRKAFEAVCRCAADFDWDAMVANMVYVWTGLTQAIGLRYYGIPGIEVPPDSGFQYLEPPEGEAFMRADEYDALIEDPTAFLYNTWLPRVARDVPAPGQPASYRGHLALVKGGMAMMDYFTAFGPQCARLRNEFGMPGAIAGILKAPLDIIADKLRGYVGLTMDLMSQPDKVRRACEALAPHLCHVAACTADPARQLPVGFWMHRGCVPFVTPEQFDTIYWPTLKPIILELWRQGHQTLFYAEGNWNHHLDAFAELPARSIVYHVDHADIFEVHRRLGDRFCLSGGIPNTLLWNGSPDDVRGYAKKVIDGVAANGGYIMDASAIMQNDTSIENLQALTAFTREYGAYSPTEDMPLRDPDAPAFTEEEHAVPGEPPTVVSGNPPGVCLPWDQIQRELPPVSGDPALLREIWSNVDGLGNMFVWQCLLSF
jgi:uroporphyrinogen-III decarboxylase